MARFLLACLVTANVLATLAMARPLRDAAAPATVEVHVADGAPLASMGVSLHGGELRIAAGPASLRHAPRHKPFDKSIAGAEVILGALATAVCAAVFCYIRVTRRRSQEPQENKS